LKIAFYQNISFITKRKNPIVCLRHNGPKKQTNKKKTELQSQHILNFVSKQNESTKNE